MVGPFDMFTATTAGGGLFVKMRTPEKQAMR